MGAVRLVFGAEFGRRWRSWLVLIVLIALVGGVVLAAVAAGRRTATAFPRFVVAHGYDVVVYNTQPVPGLARLPEVASATEVLGPLNGQPTCACTHVINPSDLGILELSPRALQRAVKLVAGRMPDQTAPDQVLASFTLQHDAGVHLGTVIHVPFYAASQAAEAFNGTGSPAGPTIALHVVGIEAAITEFPSGGTTSYDLYGTQAFARTVLPRTATVFAYMVQLRHGARDLPRFNADTGALGVAGISSQSGAEAAVTASIHPQAVGWWVLAFLAALAGLAVIGQALGRQSVVESQEYPTLATLGLLPRQLALLGLLRTLAVAVAGAAGAVALAAALSPLTPVGEARVADPSTGFTFDPLVLLLGALATVMVVVVLGVWPALRASRARHGEDRVPDTRPSPIVASLAASGAPPSAVMGVRHALVRGRGQGALPVGTALFGTVLAVTALCATAVFGASLAHLTATPALYGDPFQVETTGLGPSLQQERTALLTSMEHDRAISRITLGVAEQVLINKVSVEVLAGTGIRGPILLSTIGGRFPTGTGEIALGATTMRQVGAHVGSVVRVTVPVGDSGTRTVPFRVVSRVSIPGDVGSGGLGTGAAMTIDAYLDAVCPPGPARSTCRDGVGQNLSYAILASTVPGQQGRAAITHYVDAYGAKRPVTPTSLVNFGEAVNFPLLLGLVLALFGAATLVHLLVVSVVRRRREIGLLKALGFVNGQVGAVVSWQATTVAVVGIVAGVPLGVAIGQAVWRAFATNLGAVPVSTVPVWLITALALGVLVVANLLAIAPAMVAGRSQPAQLLRAQ